MGLYEGRDLSVDMPEGWTDRTVIAFSPPAKKNGKSGPSFVVTRDAMPAGESLKTFASKQLTEMAKGLRNFNLRETREVAFVGGSAPQFEFTWVGPNGPSFNSARRWEGRPGSPWRAPSHAPRIAAMESVSPPAPMHSWSENIC